MCEKCNHQSVMGYCSNPKSNNYDHKCPGKEYGADIRECEFSSVVRCSENTCQKCEGVPKECKI
jgi:hypothetical protein